MDKIPIEELLRRTEKPGELSVKYHRFYEGKIEIVPKCPIRSLEDFSIWYTPRVAKPCREIGEDREKVYDYTNKWNNVAVVTDGTRVLGMGRIGPEAGMPVMAGKALLFKYLGGVDAFPICLATQDGEEIIKVVKWIQPTFGGINLEDIESPKCFYILDTLRRELEIPVWHDDQQGTATVVIAGLINALKVVGKRLREITLAMVGAGAASMRTALLLIEAGVNPGNIIMVDSKGILHAGRRDLEEAREGNPYKWRMCLETNSEGRTGGIREALKDMDVCIALSVSRPGTIRKEWIADMAKEPIVFALANPLPEIWPWECKEAGARIVATGRSDFPNQVNNSLGFPSIFRGSLDVRARAITDDMCLAAAYELAQFAEEKGLREEYFIPRMDEWDVYPREAVAVALKAMEQGVAGLKLSRDELHGRATFIIERARKLTQTMMKEGLIQPPPAEM